MELKCFRCGTWNGDRCDCRDGQTLFNGDCLQVLPELPPAAAAVADPPYGETSLKWDRPVSGWTDLINAPAIWCFGSLRFFLSERDEFAAWKLAQEIIWEKQNGSNFANDRFRRVHEIVAHFYRGKWSSVTKNVQKKHDAKKKTICRNTKPAHTREINSSFYESVDGGPLLFRSVVQVRNCHGRAVHPTQKPIGIVEPLILYSTNPGELVVDPFAGSGSTLLAAKKTGRRGIGIEIDPDNCRKTVERLRGNFLYDQRNQKQTAEKTPA